MSSLNTSFIETLDLSDEFESIGDWIQELHSTLIENETPSIQKTNVRAPLCILEKAFEKLKFNYSIKYIRSKTREKILKKKFKSYFNRNRKLLKFNNYLKAKIRKSLKIKEKLNSKISALIYEIISKDEKIKINFCYEYFLRNKIKQLYWGTKFLDKKYKESQLLLKKQKKKQFDFLVKLDLEKKKSEKSIKFVFLKFIFEIFFIFFIFYIFDLKLIKL